MLDVCIIASWKVRIYALSGRGAQQQNASSVDHGGVVRCGSLKLFAHQAKARPAAAGQPPSVKAAGREHAQQGRACEGNFRVIPFRPPVSPVICKQQIGRTPTAGGNVAPRILDAANSVEGLQLTIPVGMRCLRFDPKQAALPDIQ